MKTRVDQATQRHGKGYNCAQAVACTYCDLVGADEVTMFKMTEALGLGGGSMEGTCGAVAGACVVAGVKNSCGDLEKPESKASTYKLSREITQRFLQANGSVICKELKGVETGKMLRSCPDCIRDASRILEETLFGDETGEDA